MKKLLATLAALLSAGCAQMSPAIFERGSVDQKQFAKDAYECERDARSIQRSGDCGEMEMYETCMRSKGYKEVPGSAQKGLCAKIF